MSLNLFFSRRTYKLNARTVYRRTLWLIGEQKNFRRSAAIWNCSLYQVLIQYASAHAHQQPTGKQFQFTAGFIFEISCFEIHHLVLSAYITNNIYRLVHVFLDWSIQCVYNIPTMQFFTGISRNTRSKCHMLSLTECIRDFQNNALWDTH